MFINVTFSRFCDEFKRCGRHVVWTRAGLKLLYDHVDGDIELDVIGFDSEYAEFESIDAAANALGTTIQEVERDHLVLEGDFCVVISN